MTAYHRINGFEYAGMPLAECEWLILWNNLAEHNRKAIEQANSRKPGSLARLNRLDRLNAVQPAPDRQNRDGGDISRLD